MIILGNLLQVVNMDKILIVLDVSLNQSDWLSFVELIENLSNDEASDEFMDERSMNQVSQDKLLFVVED